MEEVRLTSWAIGSSSHYLQSCKNSPAGLGSINNSSLTNSETSVRSWDHGLSLSRFRWPHMSKVNLWIYIYMSNSQWATGATLWKINGWNPKTSGLRRCFSFSNEIFSGSMLVFGGCICSELLFPCHHRKMEASTCPPFQKQTMHEFSGWSIPYRPMGC